PKILGKVDFLAIYGDTSVGDTHNQPSLDHTFQLDMIGDFLGRGQNLPSEFNLASTQSASAAFVAFPGEEEAHQLPHGVQAKTARHDGDAREVTFEEPEVRVNVELGDNFALVELAPFLADVGNPIQHQHVGDWKLCVAGSKHAAVTAFNQLVKAVRVLFFESCHKSK